MFLGGLGGGLHGERQAADLLEAGAGRLQLGIVRGECCGVGGVGIHEIGVGVRGDLAQRRDDLTRRGADTNRHVEEQGAVDHRFASGRGVGQGRVPSSAQLTLSGRQPDVAR